MNCHTLSRDDVRPPDITCDLDGQKHLTADDATFSDAGKVGLWSRADAQWYFADLSRLAGE